MLAHNMPALLTPDTIMNAKCVQAQGSGTLSTFEAMPTEIYIEIMKIPDPVTQMCLGLTCRKLHTVFHYIYGTLGEDFNIKGHPFNLDMQNSVCGQYTLNWWWDDYYLRGTPDIVWDKTLGQLLFDEKWLWDDLSCCWGCLKYKPDQAYDGFEWEDEMLEKYKGEVALMEESDLEWFYSCCRKCRAKTILVSWDQREEFLEGNEWEGKISLGLMKSSNKNDADGNLLQETMNGEQWHPRESNFDRWEDVFPKLGI